MNSDEFDEMDPELVHLIELMMSGQATPEQENHVYSLLESDPQIAAAYRRMNMMRALIERAAAQDGGGLPEECDRSIGLEDRETPETSRSEWTTSAMDRPVDLTILDDPSSEEWNQKEALGQEQANVSDDLSPSKSASLPEGPSREAVGSPGADPRTRLAALQLEELVTTYASKRSNFDQGVFLAKLAEIDPGFRCILTYVRDAGPASLTLRLFRKQFRKLVINRLCKDLSKLPDDPRSISWKRRVSLLERLLMRFLKKFDPSFSAHKQSYNYGYSRPGDYRPHEKEASRQNSSRRRRRGRSSEDD